MDDFADSGGGSAMQFLSCGRLFSHALDQFDSRLSASISTLSAAIETVENSLVRPHECVVPPHSPHKNCKTIWAGIKSRACLFREGPFSARRMAGLICLYFFVASRYLPPPFPLRLLPTPLLTCPVAVLALNSAAKMQKPEITSLRYTAPALCPRKCHSLYARSASYYAASVGGRKTTII